MKREYRCPVCSHADEVELVGDGTVRELVCSHCGTRLVLEAVEEDTLTVEVRVGTGDEGRAES